MKKTVDNSDAYEKRKEILEILDKIWPGLPDERRMAASICQVSAPENISEADLIKGAESISFLYKSYTTWDDDSYWLAQSPFDKRWYLFAIYGLSTSLPKVPIYSEDEYPAWFDEE